MSELRHNSVQFLNPGIEQILLEQNPGFAVSKFSGLLLFCQAGIHALALFSVL